MNQQILKALLIALFSKATAPAGQTEQDKDDLFQSIEDAADNASEDTIKRIENVAKKLESATTAANKSKNLKELLKMLSTDLNVADLTELSAMFPEANVDELINVIKDQRKAPENTESYNDIVTAVNEQKLTRGSFRNGDVVIKLSQKENTPEEKTLTVVLSATTLVSSKQDNAQGVVGLLMTYTYLNEKTGALESATVQPDATNLFNNILPQLKTLLIQKPTPQNNAALDWVNQLITQITDAGISGQETNSTEKILNVLAKYKPATRECPIKVTSTITIREQDENTTYTVDPKNPLDGKNKINTNSNSAKKVADAVIEVCKSKGYSVPEKVFVCHTQQTTQLVGISNATDTSAKQLEQFIENALTSSVNLDMMKRKMNEDTALNEEKVKKALEYIEAVSRTQGIDAAAKKIIATMKLKGLGLTQEDIELYLGLLNV